MNSIFNFKIEFNFQVLEFGLIDKNKIFIKIFFNIYRNYIFVKNERKKFVIIHF